MKRLLSLIISLLTVCISLFIISSNSTNSYNNSFTLQNAEALADSEIGVWKALEIPTEEVCHAEIPKRDPITGEIRYVLSQGKEVNCMPTSWGVLCRGGCHFEIL